MRQHKTIRFDQAEAYRPRLRQHIGTGRHILVIAQPKSGSTALCNILSEVTGWPIDSYADRSVYDLSFSTLKATSIANEDRVIHLHSLPTPFLRAWILERRMIPIVLYRDILASIVSMYYHQVRSDASLSDRIRSLSCERGIEETAWMWAHWFARFQREWHGTLAHEPGFWISHAELFDRPTKIVTDFLQINNFSIEGTSIYQATETVLKDTKRSNYYASKGSVPSHILEAVQRLSN